ncbi:MAG: hypothetical protein U0N90_02975 [Blautia sp.]|jgi:hypothetical protein
MSDLTERYRLAQLIKQREDGAKKKKLRWNTATQVRRSLARVNNWVANGEITAKEANAIYYSANLILKALELEQQKMRNTSQEGKKS